MSSMKWSNCFATWGSSCNPRSEALFSGSMGITTWASAGIIMSIKLKRKLIKLKINLIYSEKIMGIDVFEIINFFTHLS